MDIHVFSYLKCLQEVVNKDDTRSLAIISIQDAQGFGFEFVKCDKVRDVLTLCFDDADTEKGTVRSESISDFDDKVKTMKIFSDEDAEKVVQFVKKNLDVDDLYIHCYAGVSRSQAVGAAISKWMGMSDERFFRVGIPNMRVYRKLLEHFMSE